MDFKIENFDTSGSLASNQDLVDTLGGIVDGSEGHGAVGTFQSDHMRVVSDSNGAPVFLAPVNDPNASVIPIFLDTATIADDPANYEVIRQGNASLSDYDAAVGNRLNIGWGVWNSSPGNGAELYPNPNDATEVLSKDDVNIYWISAEAASTASLTGTSTFTSSYFLGSGSSGDVIGLSGSFQVNFDSGVIDNGNLSLQTFGSENWSMTYGGTYQDSQAHMTIIDGDITGATNCTSCVTGHIDGIFVAPGDAFVGGFNLENVNDKNTHVEGVMLMEQ